MYIIPQFLKNINSLPSSPGFGQNWFEQIGKYLMWFGAALAILSTLQMFLFGKGTPLVATPPKKILSTGIFGIVRHPMMWSITFVLMGESITYGSFILILWLIAWVRIGHLIVVNYEEPQLERRFGDEYIKYCKKVPRWIPRFSFKKTR